MKKIVLLFCLLGMFTTSKGQGELKIWNEFLDLLKNNQMNENKIIPLEQLGDKFKPILLGFLDSVRLQASDSDWHAIPEIIKTDNRIQFILPWTTRGEKVNYCFSFLIKGDQWYFQHLESIFIRLDRLPPLPVSEFPDVSENQKAWAREEIYWSFVVQNIYLPIAAEKGKEYALNILKDGGGYVVGAKTWVPFTTPQKAYILYLCWEQANLRGNGVILEKLTDEEAIVHLETQFFYLYFISGHLKPKISIENYKQIFETIWLDRAEKAGWNLEIKYSPDYKVDFIFTVHD